MKRILVALIFLPCWALASPPYCEVVVCEKQEFNGKIIPPALQSVKKEVCFTATVSKKAAVAGEAYKPTFRSVQTAHKAKRLYIKRVIGCRNIPAVNIGGKNV